jgi:hypothetical protein
MTITNVKAMIAKTMTAGLLAGAFFLASPSKAQAQVSWGIHVGVPVQTAVYGAPAYGYDQPSYGYYGGYDRRFDDRRRYEYERHEQMERREQWERQQAYRRHEEHEEHERMEHGGYGYYGR